jgi:hypothetical protein
MQAERCAIRLRRTGFRRQLLQTMAHSLHAHRTRMFESLHQIGRAR